VCLMHNVTLRMQFFVQKNERQVGPFSETRIRRGIDAREFSPDDLAWTPGKASWRKLSTLLNLDPGTPPPFGNDATQEISEPLNADKGRNFALNILTIAIFLSFVALLVVLGYAFNMFYTEKADKVKNTEAASVESSQVTPTSALPSTTPDTSTPVPTPALADSIRVYDNMEKSDGRIHMHGVVDNLNRSVIPLLTLQWNLYDQNGMQVGEAFASISNIEAGGRATFSSISSTRASRVDHFKLVKTIVF
jgi:hypothetical protein